MTAFSHFCFGWLCLAYVVNPKERERFLAARKN